MLFQSRSKVVGGVHIVDESAKLIVSHRPGVRNIIDGRASTGSALTTSSWHGRGKTNCGYFGKSAGLVASQWATYGWSSFENYCIGVRTTAEVERRRIRYGEGEERIQVAGYGFDGLKICGVFKRDQTIGSFETQLLVRNCPLGTWEPGSGWNGEMVDKPHREPQQPKRN